METDEVYAQMVLQPLTQVTYIVPRILLVNDMIFFSCYQWFSTAFDFRKSRRIHLYRLNWESRASNLAITSARR